MATAYLPVAPVATRHRLVREGVQGIDRMSFDHLAEALSHVVEQMDKPVVVGIFAPWGAGKVGFDTIRVRWDVLQGII